MANSITFNSVNLGDYDLIITGYDFPVSQIAEYTQLRDISYSWGNWLPPKEIALGASVTGTTRANLNTKLDSIRLALNERTDEILLLAIQTDRYWMARFRGFTGAFVTATTWIGQILFTCYDPFAYSIDPEEDTGALAIDTAPSTTVEVTTEGTARIEPIYTLTATGGVVTAATVKLENTDTLEEIIWVGTVANTQSLVIDTVRWIIENDGVASMATVTGQFPRLLANQVNDIKVTGFGTTGHLTVTYRNRFL